MTTISLFDHPQICAEIGLRDITVFNTFLRLSSTIYRRLKEYIPLIRNHYPYHGLRFPIYCWIHSDLGPIDFSNSGAWYFLDKRILPRIPVRPEFANIKTWEDLHPLIEDQELRAVNGDRMTVWWDCNFVETQEPYQTENGATILFMTSNVGQLGWGLQTSSSGTTSVVVSTESGSFEVVSRSLPEFLSELFLLSDIFVLESNLENYISNHEENPTAESYLQSLIPRWPRNPEGSYDFCSLCEKGKFLAYTGQRFSCKRCPKFDVCAECIVECDHSHPLYDCIDDTFFNFCSGCNGSLWITRGYIFTCKENISNSIHSDQQYCLECVKSGQAKHGDCVCDVDLWLISHFCNECQNPISRDDAFYTCSICPQYNPEDNTDSYDLCQQCKLITYHEHDAFLINLPPHKECTWSQCTIDTASSSFLFCRVCEQISCLECAAEWTHHHPSDHVILSSDFGK